VLTGRAHVRACATQTLGDSRAAEYMKGRKTLEINPDHPIVAALKDKVETDAAGAQVWCTGSAAASFASFAALLWGP
jgi:heat shock protein beta